MILPPATLGILGGSPLGRYFVMAAHELGYRVMVLDPDRESPAGCIADEHLAAAYDDPDALDRIAKNCAAVTTEFESVPAKSLAYLARYVPVRPGAEAVAICQDRSTEKGFLKTHGFPYAPYADIRVENDIWNADTRLFPAILKIARLDCDGRGQARVPDRSAALDAFLQFGGQPCVLEQLLTLDYEMSVVLTRDASGHIESFPVTENHHRRGVLDYSIVPARDSTGYLRTKAAKTARVIAGKMDYVGTMSVGFFVVEGQLLVNEIAPRPHNSGHYTLDACTTNQFEQQVRALCGLPLGDVSAHSGAAMVNLLGDIWFVDGDSQAREPDWQKLLSVPNLKLHLYGKRDALRGRKMGHITVLGESAEIVRRTAMTARAAIGIGDE